jgi:hypothetical protein
MNRLRVTLLAAALLAATAVDATWASRQGSAFPHDRHNRVFPVCEGCHAGVVNGEARQVFPRYEDCQRCHDGTRVKLVDWQPPAPRASLVRFSHPAHRVAVAATGDSTSCQTCHAVRDAATRMSVAGPNPGRCVGCHANSSNRHIAPDAPCRTCHVPIAAQANLPVQRIARFPKPDWHDDSGFAGNHGRVPSAQEASCAICHARESCERCHANADRVPLIASLARDARIATLAATREAAYEAPVSHRDRDWRLEHGRKALESTGACANCHTQSSCSACHASGNGTSRSAILALPAPDPRGRLGVRAERMARPFHPADIVSRHGTLAAGGDLTCMQCHTEQTCSGCHAAQDSRRFHADNFVERHAVDVFASAADCQSCHNTERFCRDCHARTGVASSGRMNAAFHDGKATWVLSHGQAARTGMESCASCHRQVDCVRCHSASGGWGVNPHRAGFRAGALSARNASSCQWCHLGALPGGGR